MYFMLQFSILPAGELLCKAVKQNSFQSTSYPKISTCKSPKPATLNLHRNDIDSTESHCPKNTMGSGAGTSRVGKYNGSC